MTAHLSWDKSVAHTASRVLGLTPLQFRKHYRCLKLFSSQNEPVLFPQMYLLLLPLPRTLLPDLRTPWLPSGLSIYAPSSAQCPYLGTLKMALELSLLTGTGNSWLYVVLSPISI